MKRKNTIFTIYTGFISPVVVVVKIFTKTDLYRDDNLSKDIYISID